MRLAALWLALLPVGLSLHPAPGRAGEETGGIGGTGVAVEVGRINGVNIQATNQYGRVAARYDNRRNRNG